MQEKISSTSLTQPSKWTQNKVGVFWTKRRKDDGKSYLAGSFEIEGPNGVVQKIPVAYSKMSLATEKRPIFRHLN